MPSIQGGGGYIPQPIQPQRQLQQAAVAKAEAPQSELAPKDTFKAAPSQTSLTSQAAQRLTSDETKSMIHQLIQRSQPQVPQDKPQLLMMERPAMSSALADTLKGHHVPEQQQAQQQLNQPANNPQAQAAAGQMYTSTIVKMRDHTEDSVARNSLQSGKRVRKEEQEGEFSSLEDFGGGGGMGGQDGQDQRSDSQKKKQILTAEEKRKAPPGAKSALVKPPAPKNNSNLSNTPPKPPAPKTSTIQRVQPPLGQQKPAAPKKKTDEWTF